MTQYPPLSETVSNANISQSEFLNAYEKSIANPDAFWREQAKRLDWVQFPTIIKNTSFNEDLSIRWFEDGTLNAAYNCIDRHVAAGFGGEIALIWEGDNPELDQKITYQQLQDEVSKLANALKSLDVKKGDRVLIYLPMIPEAVFAMLACARIGAVHSVVFGGFSTQSIQSRLEDCQAKIVMTADAGIRGGKLTPFKHNVDSALPGSSVEKVLVFKDQNTEITWDEQRDVDWKSLISKQSTECPCELMNAEDPLFILYTSGSTGKPKGALHTTGGYLLYASLTHEVIFDYKPGEVYWCTADVGWITGHSYIVYGPLANRATSLIFEGVPQYPDWSRFWQVVDKHQVNIFYTAPTAIRALLCEGDEWVNKTQRNSLRVLGTVGEPINQEAWEWYYRVIGNGKCPIIDTWWQTETGGHMVAPTVTTTLKPTKAQTPFWGVKPGLVDHDGNLIEGPGKGNFVILDSWPGQMRTVYGNHDRYKDVYFSQFPGMYFTGDGAERDEDGDYRITGRVDDLINVSGHLLGTAEIENAINTHPSVSESAVIGYPHDIKGQGIYAFVILHKGDEVTEESLISEIIQTVRKQIGPVATPDIVQLTLGLPKTRSGKIMRRILRKIAANEVEQIGDTTTLADPAVVEALIKESATLQKKHKNK